MQVPTGFQVVHANKLEDLRAVTVEIIRKFPLAPLENDVFLVHSNGIAQWLKLALARDDDDPELAGNGIAAAMQFSLPSRFLWQVYRTVLGEDQVPQQSPFDKNRMTWRLMRLIPEIAEEPEFEPLARFLTGSQQERRRYQLAERVADLFDQYQVYRADWLEDWSEGDDVIRIRAGEHKPVPGEQRWQPALWRRLIADIEGSGANTSRAEVHTRFLDAMRSKGASERPRDLPRRIIVFGLSSLPQQTLDVLSSLGQCCQVILCVHNPSQYHWADIIEDRDLLRAERRRRDRKPGMPVTLNDHNQHLHAHPLLAAWGKQGRDYIRLLDSYDAPELYAHWLDRVDLFRESEKPNLLGSIQNDILDLNPVLESAREKTSEDAADRSLVFHCTHGPLREVEVLHDQLLAAFSEDETLKPQDIIVMVPDINAYSPHIEAVFGQLDPSDDRYIPYTISDQGQRHQVPVLVALEALLSLPESRLAVSDVLDLLDVAPLRQRFALAEDDLPQLHDWIRGANIRWGLDDGHRASLDLPEGLFRNTWLFGLRRMLLGYATGDGAAWQAIEPFAEVGGLESRLAGQLDSFVERLQSYWEKLSQPRTPSVWADILNQLLRDFFVEPEGEDVLLFSQLEAAVEQWLDACEEAELEDELPLHIVRDVLLEQLDQGGLSQRFLAGKVNFATLLPMRAIPFRRVCLLGMNDGDYPRTQPPMDFDLMARDYRPGDRSRREDDRFLFLEAFLSARDQFYISWVGRSIHDNSERPPSVLVAQLRDHIDAIRVTDGREKRLSAVLTTSHPLQPFSMAYFPAQADGGPLFTYAREWRSALDARELEQATPGLKLDGPPAEVFDQPLSLGQLIQFLRKPVDVFFQQRLGVYFELDTAESEDEEPIVLDGLERWKLTDRLVQDVVRQETDGEHLLDHLTNAAQRAVGRGELALAEGLAELQIRQAIAPLPELYTRYQALVTNYPDTESLRPLRIEVPVDANTLRLEDWVRDLRHSAEGSSAQIHLSSSNLTSPDRRYRWHQLLRPWVHHLAANAVASPVTSYVLSQAGDVTLNPVSTETARAQLESLVAAWIEALQEPLPVAPKTAFAWLNAESKGPEQMEKAARGAYESQFMSQGECEESAYLQRVYPDFDSLWQAGAFALFADRFYRPLRDNVHGDKKTNANGAV
ncbi:exodeoxyribonuclease V subunit gamma [Marinobacter fonticola]|uniref:exodeoxyribonuclease V subunit gamma n=1 Tax=Marinobacter fonticola TaxID=2603215 RepID=UPI0011E66BF3|nr:exodeoxyribonuclease V subunit gamma [Marinobacter fonticola]